MLILLKNATIGDITAKSTTQFFASHWVGSISGSLLGMGLGKLIARDDQVFYILGLFSVLASSYLYCGFRGLQSVALQSLNIQSTSLILDRYLLDQTVPCPKTISNEESIILPSRTKGPRVILGASCTEAFRSVEEAKQLTLLHKNDNYIVSYNKKTISVLLREGVQLLDILKAFFHAYFLKNSIQKRQHGDQRSWIGEWIGKFWRNDHYNPPSSWPTICAEFTRSNFDRFVALLVEKGWDINQIRLSTQDFRTAW